ncbi:hypothetical protein P153DRAFT_393922 [Dothidotthia symphoricarpi CBS 119687]|uniref:Uncharacterized protein n=1 Tax=Dothidotthia symphoricarpi CBS 119687 TaxID=1392245 RepID=A0A6A6ALX7_9PLEO|nr:uncharacterized protein P153DRAFT_393922 [Dothidotthia symphoricarpi CBS 119687]KAF2132982.1 hypothetical protein P153DRAFT_393922 [Dothidotthia symphoricarpi CBS 119687]
MSSIYCCSDIRGYRNATLSHESKFSAFTAWSNFPKESSVTTFDVVLSDNQATFAIQVVKQVNFGPLESKRYFVRDGEIFVEVKEKWLIDANFQKLNTYKNFKCAAHNKFFELNVYQKDPVNKHHWRADIARPAAEIDL